MNKVTVVTKEVSEQTMSDIATELIVEPDKMAPGKSDVEFAAANLNIGMKPSILIYENLGMFPGIFTSRGCKVLNARRLQFAEYKAEKYNKLKRQVLQAKNLVKNDGSKESGQSIYKIERE